MLKGQIPLPSLSGGANAAEPGLRRKPLGPALLALLVALALARPAAGQARRRPSRALPLARQVEIILRHSHADRGIWGIEVARLSDGKVLYKRDSDHLFHPASNMKLFTTAAALEKLGPDFVFRTTLETANAPDAAGQIGDLILVGRGDSNLSNRVLPYHLKTERQGPADAAFLELADELKARGVREVGGNLIVDDRFFVYEPYGDNWGIGDMLWGYGAPITAVVFNDNELLLHVYPGQEISAPALVMLDPISDGLQVVNQVQTVDAAGMTRIGVERQPGSMDLDLWGQVPIGRGVYEDTLAIPDPPRLVGEILRRALEARGIAARGKLQVLELRRMDAMGVLPSFTSAGRVVLAEHDSPPLREDIQVINKVSQNLHCEMLLRTLGQATAGEGSRRAGLEALQAFVSEAGIKPEEFAFTDGSGLSRTTLVTPHAVVKLLETMARSAHFSDYFDSLPVAGVDGLLADRFADSRAQGNLFAKTGTLTGVNALSGYMDLPSRRRLVFSIIGNNYLLDSGDGTRATDDIALAIYEKFAGPRKRPKKKASH